MANLPNGTGIPALIALLDRPTENGERLDPFPAMMLAQASRRSAEAGSFLADLADAGLLSNATLISIGSVLAGAEYVLTADTANRDAEDSADDVRTTGRSLSYMKYDANSAVVWPIADIKQNLNVLDQLLATENLDPETAESWRDRGPTWSFFSTPREIDDVRPRTASWLCLFLEQQRRFPENSAPPVGSARFCRELLHSAADWPGLDPSRAP